MEREVGEEDKVKSVNKRIKKAHRNSETHQIIKKQFFTYL